MLQYAVEAIEVGKHVFCEKPLAILPEDGREIADAARKKGVISMTVFNMRYRVGYKKLKEIVASGQLGTPYHFWSHRFGMGAGGDGAIRQTNWRTDKDLCCGMTIESLSHDIDLIRWILNDEVASVAGHVHSTVADLPNFDNNAQVLMKMKGGASAIINASWSSRIGVNARGVLGSQGTAFVEGTDIGNNGIWCSTRLHIKTDADAYERVEMLHDNLDARSYKAETDDFIDAILTGQKPVASACDGYETLRVSGAIVDFDAIQPGMFIHAPRADRPDLAGFQRIEIIPVQPLAFEPFHVFIHQAVQRQLHGMAGVVVLGHIKAQTALIGFEEGQNGPVFAVDLRPDGAPKLQFHQRAQRLRGKLLADAQIPAANAGQVENGRNAFGQRRIPDLSGNGTAQINRRAGA